MINLTKISDDYIMALSALIQSAFFVEKIATSSKEIDNDLKILLESIYKTETFSAENIYGHKRNLAIGQNVLKNILNGNNEIYLMNTQKYALSIILIQKNISKINDLQDLIRKKIDNYNENSMMATNFEDLISYSERIYTEYIAIIRPRVIISGKKRVFRD